MKKPITVIHLIDWTILKWEIDFDDIDLYEDFWKFTTYEQNWTEWFYVCISADKILYLVQDYETNTNQ